MKRPPQRPKPACPATRSTRWPRSSPSVAGAGSGRRSRSAWGATPSRAEEIRRLLATVAFLERGKGKAISPGSGSGEIAAAAALAVTRLGENRVVREIGRGGMGIVYEAIQEPLGRRVAVKILPRHSLADERSRERFLREAKAVARLTHPHIVPIHALGEQDGMPYYVMPSRSTAPGSTACWPDPKGAFSPAPADPTGRRARWVAGLGRQAAEALAHAHEQGILHRDIKPANLLLDSAGTLWLADFGLAKLADDLALTGTGELPGTLRYLAPECLGHPPDARSDIYSLGLTLYELLVGRPAFGEMDRVRLLHQIQWQPVVPPSELMPDLPRDLETIILKASAQDPVDRGIRIGRGAWPTTSRGSSTAARSSPDGPRSSVASTAGGGGTRSWRRWRP